MQAGFSGRAGCRQPDTYILIVFQHVIQNPQNIVCYWRHLLAPERIRDQGQHSHSGSQCFELRRVQMVFVEQLVEFSAISFGNSRGLGHIAVGNLQQLRQVVTFKLAAGFYE
jgi:hypothetical protein